MSQHTVKAHGATKRGPLRGYHVKKIGNGVTVQTHHDLPPGGGMGAPDPEPMAFTRASQLNKHVRDLHAQMLPQADDESLEPGAPPVGQQA